MSLPLPVLMGDALDDLLPNVGRNLDLVPKCFHISMQPLSLSILDLLQEVTLLTECS